MQKDYPSYPMTKSSNHAVRWTIALLVFGVLAGAFLFIRDTGDSGVENPTASQTENVGTR